MTAYWDEVDAWAEPEPRPAPRKLGPARGSVLAAMMLGLREVLEPPPDDEVVFEVDLDERDEPHDGVLLHFDAASPRRTVAVIPPP